MKYLIAAILMVSCHTALHAQAVSNATIHGTVTDSSGAAVPNAHVKATQTETGQVTDTRMYCLICR